MSETIDNPGTYTISAGTNIQLGTPTSSPTTIAFTASLTGPPPPPPPGKDFPLFVQPNLAALDRIRRVLMTPYKIGRGNYGYNSTFGLVRGGNIEPSPAIGVTNGGYHDCIVIIDNNLEGSASLDHFNSATSPLTAVPGFAPVPTTIYDNARAMLAKAWDGVGGCSKPFHQYNYPASFSLLDRREAEYGSFGPYASQLSSASIHSHLGGIGSNCGTGGQTWYLPGFENELHTDANPLIVTVFPSAQPLGGSGDLEELSFYIDEAYMQFKAGSPASNWRNAYLNAMSSYPFGAPRQALHFIQCSRATAAWNDSTLTQGGMTAMQMLQATISKVLSPQSAGGAVGSHGGISQQWGGGGDQTPEPNFQAMIAFDDRMPSWFGN